MAPVAPSAIGIAHTWDDYGPGSHTWPYWTRDLKQTLPPLLFRRDWLLHLLVIATAVIAFA